MGFGGISIWQLLIVLAIVLLLFGTKRLRNIGSDLGNAFQGFKKAISDNDKGDNKDKKETEPQQIADEQTTAKHESTRDKTRQG